MTSTDQPPSTHVDDLELLRFIHTNEQTPSGALLDGLRLAQAFAGTTVYDPQFCANFVRELNLARAGGLLEWQERYSPGTPPQMEPFIWLQHISEIHPTIAGRDRAQGRVILQPPPDPYEDDGRPIAGIILEDVSRAIGDTYTGVQLARFLTDSGIPRELVPHHQGETKWQYVFDILAALEQGGSAARRTLRKFLGAWLSDTLHSGPDEVIRPRLLGQLGRQGWHLQDGRLVIGAPLPGMPEPPPLGARLERLTRLHPSVKEVIQRYIPDRLEVAIFEAFKTVNNRVKELTGLSIDGSDLMAQAFGGQTPRLLLADLSTATGQNIQIGYQFIFMGAVRGIRNPDAHELFVPLSDEEALEQLGLASLLMRRLDDVDCKDG